MLCNFKYWVTFVLLVIMAKNRTYTILILFLLSIAIKAQEVEGPYLVFKLLKNGSVSYLPNTYQKDRVVQDSTKHGLISLLGTKSDPEVKYEAYAGFIGRDTAVTKYKDYYGRIKYLSFVFVVSNSTIDLISDAYVAYKNDANQDVHPLENDISSIGSPATDYLRITAITASSRLIASRPDPYTIRFKPIADSIGIAYVSYTVCDTFNTCNESSITVTVVDTNSLASDTLVLGTPKATFKLVPFPLPGFTISTQAKKGTLDIVNPQVVSYKPYSSFVGNDTFVLSKGNLHRRVIMEVYNLKTPSKITVDDVVFTPKDTAVTFNVAINDITDDFPFLISQRPSRGTLDSLNTKGDFKYTPEPGYEGVQTFIYKVCPQGLCEYGEVKLFIGNWQPDTRTDYQFNTFKNVPLVFSYSIPIDAYNFKISPQDSAFVKYYPGYDTIALEYDISPSVKCRDTVSGYNLLIYFPPRNYAGNDHILVSYCIPSTGQCVDVHCAIDVKDIYSSERNKCEYQCAGDCVWPGDVNLDGEVSMKDFLQIGYHLGLKGNSRTTGAPSEFRAIQSLDWNGMMPSSDVNFKHADTDGNGLVNSGDTVSISSFYKKQHSLVAKPIYDRGDFPFKLKLLNPGVQIGQRAFFEVQLGDASNPVINLGGYSYDLDYNVDVVDEASLRVDFYEQGWATLNSALMHMYKKPWNGRLESGFVRSNGKKVSGRGGVEVLSFIVEDDLRGFRKDQDVYHIPFYISNILVLGEDGKYVKLDDHIAYLDIQKNTNQQVLSPNDLVVYPNPAKDYLSLHLNGLNELKSIAVFALDGSLLKNIRIVDKKHELLDLQELQNGLYLLKVETNLGPITKKIEIIR